MSASSLLASQPTTTSFNQLSVTRVDGLGAVARYASEIDRLNALSARPNPFLSSAFLERYSLRSEYFVPGGGEFLLLVRRASAIVGIAPLRRSQQALLALNRAPLSRLGSRVDFMVSYDTEQPGLLCAPADEERVATAVVDFLCNQERAFSLLEFVGQRPESALHRALHAVPTSDWRFRSRDIQVEPICELTLSWPDSKSYFRSLIKHMRSNISRQVRRLYTAGQVELVLARGAEATSAWFDCYCDVDRRSWKQHTSASISRHPRRLNFYRDLVAGRAGFEPSFVGVVLDGVLIGGLILGSNRVAAHGRYGTWALEMAYDRTRAALGPGQLLLFLAISEAIEQRSGFLNMLQNFAYYKHRWGASEIEVVNAQLIRNLSLHAVRAGAHDAREWWRERMGIAQQEKRTSSAAQVSESTARERSDADQSFAEQLAPTFALDLESARRLTAQAQTASPSGLRRLDRAAARAYLPFDLE